MDNNKVFTSFPLLTSNTSWERSHSQHRLAATTAAGFSASRGTLSPCPLTSQCSVCSDWVLSELSCPLAAHGPLYQPVAVRPESIKEFPPPPRLLPNIANTLLMRKHYVSLDVLQLRSDQGTVSQPVTFGGPFSTTCFLEFLIGLVE